MSLMLPIPARAPADPLRFKNSELNDELPSVPVCQQNSDNDCEDESPLDTRLFAAVCNARLNSGVPCGDSDDAASDSTMASLEGTKKVYFDEQVRFRFHNFPVKSADKSREDVDLTNDIKCFDGGSLYAVAGGCKPLWEFPTLHMLDKMVEWMTTPTAKVTPHRQRSRSHGSSEDMSSHGYIP
ncbi:hypothetical protein Pmar_PMAR015290 [Perkinsus marinus ATCC 50983]|uniref:Uncharacterized protein n=1 Tax=Perkinsus marinus (strain ATCC 50983 / TXsc) TaxID=423536 RepID=C5KL85_PERM5|nr:hypothetical protein Pmar_PMAR015290 [Perkinsus marinus ATCC 50983]EER14758.1 hypothetical protein Pmar_PMAR015290 [Perkinsus marinus ATCC 50983]|eukprot:XP_002782962.1 hypothetical protein Pmar_PMAR015290 [Perkinsus marinus ATCC 50983]